MARHNARRTPRKSSGRPRYQPALDARTMEDLLSGARAELALSLIPEPALLFGGKQACEDPKTGLRAYGPYSRTDATRRPIIRIGVVGPAEAIDRALWLARLSHFARFFRTVELYLLCLQHEYLKKA